MINIDNVEKFVTEELAQGEHFSLRKEGWIELITRLRKAEKDAARYRWLRDPSIDVSMVIDKRTSFNPPSDDGITSGYYDYEYRSGNELDDSIDEAMQCNK